MNEVTSVQSELNEILKKDSVVLFLKGCGGFPVCGLSSTVCYMLKRSGIKYACVNLLSHPKLYQFMKEKYSPILAPYLYINGKFIGGFDEISALFNENKLQSACNENYAC